MSRIDDNSDDQRIKEMQQAELQARKDRDVKDANSRITKSFQEVMREKAQKTSATETAKKEDKSKDSAKKGQNFSETLLKKTPKTPAELARRAALSRATQQNMSSARTDEQQKLRQTDAERSEDIVKKTEDDRERIDREVRDGENADLKRSEDKEVAFKKSERDAENQNGGQGAARDRGSRGHGGGEQEDRRPNEIRAPEAPKSAQGATPRGIPPEVIEKLVSAIHAATKADGRTEMHIELKGSMLEGVRLKVTAERGKVHCTFEGCDKEMKSLLESSKGALMRGLEKRGLTLTGIKVL